MTDGRKRNRPPPNPPAIDAETVKAIDEVIAKGVKQKWVAKQLGIHDRTVMSAVNRTGAYARIPKQGSIGMMEGIKGASIHKAIDGVSREDMT